MTENPAQSKTYRRQRMQLLIIPMVVALLLIILVTALLVIPGSVLRLDKWELSIVTDTMTILMFLCPLMLCTIPLYLLLAATIYGLGKVHNLSENSLKRAHSATSSVADRTENIAQSLSNRSIGIAAWFTFLDKLISSRSTAKDQLESDTSNE